MKKTFLILIFVFVSGQLVMAQDCDTVVVPPDTINGNIITETFSGSVSSPFISYTSCSFFIPKGAILLGEVDTFEYTFNFSIPVNAVDIIITATGGINDETFTITTNAGALPVIIDQGSCFTSVSGNVITSGAGSPNGVVVGPDGFGGGGGVFTILNNTPYTQLTISGPGGVEGSIFALCKASISRGYYQEIDICEGDTFYVGPYAHAQSGIYQDTLLDPVGSDSIVITTLTVIPLPSATINMATSEYCYTDTDIILTAQETGGVWSGSGITDSLSGDFDPTVAGIGMHEIIFIREEQCTNTDTIFITVKSVPELTYTVDFDCVLGTGEVDLEVTSGLLPYSYNWDNGEAVEDLFDLDNGTYTVVVTDSLQCSATTSVDIETPAACFSIFVPNAFTPNGDGLNDVFSIDQRVITDLKLYVFDRWGHMIAEIVDVGLGWDGMFEGIPVLESVYAWKLTYTDQNGVYQEKRGKVNVLR